MLRRTMGAMVAAALAAAPQTLRAAPPSPAVAPSAPAAAAAAAPGNAITELLFWPQPVRDANFRRMEQLTPTHTVRRGPRVHRLPAGRPLHGLAWTSAGAPQTLESYMTGEHVSAVMVLQDGKVRLERYGLGYGPAGRWTSFSVAKSFTSTLAGAAVKDGYIKSVEDPIVRYLPELKGSAYDGVSIRQVLTMTSGVKWNEDYTDPNSDVVLSGKAPAGPGQDPVLAYMSKLPREAPPGTKWVYKTGETNLIGVLVSHATHKTLADYLSEKVWRPYGMEQDAAWITSPTGQEFGGFGLSVALHDYARMGQFILEGGHGVLPSDWLAKATTKQADIGAPGHGYGYQWWTNDDGTYDARGIFGQMIHIDPRRRLVVAINGDWPTAVGPQLSAKRQAFLDAVTAAVDRS